MIDEPTQELAALHALGLLEGGEAAEFARRLAAEPDLAQLAAELRETTAALALAAPRVQPPERLKTALLAHVAEPLRPDFRRASSAGGRAWLPWAAAAALLVCSGTLLADRVRLHRELSRLQRSDALAQVQLRALKAAAGQDLTAVAVVAWDPVKGRGVFEVQQLPASAPDQDYQLWAIDPSRPGPVSAGVFHVDASGRAELHFRPVEAGLRVANFAVSREPAGGSPVATGPILLVGQ